MSEMQRPEWKPVTVEIAEIGREVLKFTFATPQEFQQWWHQGDNHEIPLYGDESLGEDF